LTGKVLGCSWREIGVSFYSLTCFVISFLAMTGDLPVIARWGFSPDAAISGLMPAKFEIPLLFVLIGRQLVRCRRE